MNLDYIVMKAERAQMHLDGLTRELGIFLNQPDAVVRKYFVKGDRYVCRTHYASIPPIIGSLLGEFLYCLRSGLDQLAWQLALPTARAQSARQIYFPIFDSVADARKKREWRRIIELFPQPVGGVIESLQPYHAGVSKQHALSQLQELCNIDKHRIIPIHSRSLEVFVPINPNVQAEHYEREDAIEVSVPLADMNQLQDFTVKSAMQIDFGEWRSDLMISQQRLSEILSFVKNDMIPKFARFAAEVPDPPSLRIDDPPKAVYGQCS